MGAEFLGQIVQEIFGKISEFVAKSILKGMSRGVHIPRCPNCGNEAIERWAPFPVKVVFFGGVMVYALSLTAGFFWVLFFVLSILTSDFTYLPWLIGWGTVIALLVVVGAGGTIFYKTFPPKRCRRCNSRWLAPTGTAAA